MNFKINSPRFARNTVQVFDFMERQRKNRRSVRLWTPADIATLAWYDASDASTITEIGGSVSTLADKSTFGRDLIQTTALSQPTTGIRQINGVNVLDFAKDYLLWNGTDMTPLDGNVIIFTVSENGPRLASTSLDGLFSYGNGEGSVEGVTLRANSPTNFHPSFVNNGIGTDFDSAPNNGASIYCIQADFENNNFFGFVDGGRQYDGTGAYTNKLVCQKFTLHERFFENRPLEGATGEAIIINSNDTLDRQKVEGYLAWKWGLVANLPIDHPYKNGAPTV